MASDGAVINEYAVKIMFEYPWPGLSYSSGLSSAASGAGKMDVKEYLRIE